MLTMQLVSVGMGWVRGNYIFNEDPSGDSEIGHLQVTMLFPEKQSRQDECVQSWVA